MISPQWGRNTIKTQVLRAGQNDSALAKMAAIAVPLILIAPAIWNGYPPLQYDTGGYLARWYEGYLVPSRSTVFGLPLGNADVAECLRGIYCGMRQQARLIHINAAG